MRELFTAALLTISTLASAAEREVWIGEVALPGTPLGFTATLAPAADGWTGKVSIPLQGAVDLPLSEVRTDPEAVHFVLRPPGQPEARRAVFHGDRTGDEAVGQLEQMGQSFPLKMHLAAEGESTGPNRPQTPKGPFPYTEVEVTYTHGGLPIAGTLTLPAGRGPHPAVLLITGSGAQDRDETIFAHKPFAVLADHLTRQGIAVLRSDDRGVGGTGGSLPQATADDLVGDALAGVQLLARRKDIDPKRIGVVGHSEGGILGPMAAVRSRDVAFVVMLAGTGLPGRDILMLQGRSGYETLGARGADLDRLLALHAQALDAEPAGREAAIRALVEAQTALRGSSTTGEALEATVKAAVASFQTPWFQSFVHLDPRVALRQVEVPVLALSGSLDFQVPPDANLPEIRAALSANKDVEIEELVGLNHLFQPAETGLLDEYGQIEITIDPPVLDKIAGWILERFGP